MKNTIITSKCTKSTNKIRKMRFCIKIVQMHKRDYEESIVLIIKKVKRK